VFSHLDHGLKGGHRAVHAFLSGVKTADAKAMPEGNISLDQRAAEFVGSKTRFPSLNLGVGGDCEMSWTRNSVHVPPLTRAPEVFRALFVQDNAAALRQRAQRNGLDSSILDTVNEHARRLSGRLGQPDRDKLGEYLNSIRDVERRIEMSNEWLQKPKPDVAMKEPANGSFMESIPIFFDLIALAFQTDSTRVATLEIPPGLDTTDFALQKNYHGYSHHGKAEENLKGLLTIERFQMEQVARFIGRLKSMPDPLNGGTMLDHTMVLFGSGMGNGSSHTNADLPVLLAGGGFKHRGHLRLPEEGGKRVPLCNLYLSMLQRFGVETNRFGTSSGTLNGLA
jgi:hypothetical protein